MGQLKQYLVYFVLFGDPMPVELYVKIIPKLLFPPDKSFLCLRFAHIENEVGDLAPDTSSARNQVSLVLGKELLVDAGYVIKSFRIRIGGKFGKIVVSRFIFRQ